MLCIITYFKLRVNQNFASNTFEIFLIITYFKLRVNQNFYENGTKTVDIITYFKLRVNQNGRALEYNSEKL